MDFSFIVSAIKSPTEIGAIAPSSKYLARKMVESVKLSKTKAVVEVGTGTGKITQVIYDSLPPGTMFLSVEKNKSMFEAARRNLHNDINVVNIDILSITEKLVELNMDVDCILSSLPLTIWPTTKQKIIIKKMHETLTDNGQMVFFSYLSSSIAARKELLDNIKLIFSTIEMSSIVWRNIPPAMIYICSK